MQNKLKLTDFAFGRDPEAGITYQYAPFTIIVERQGYSVVIYGQLFDWGYKTIAEALEVINKFRDEFKDVLSDEERKEAADDWREHEAREERLPRRG